MRRYQAGPNITSTPHPTRRRRTHLAPALVLGGSLRGQVAACVDQRRVLSLNLRHTAASAGPSKPVDYPFTRTRTRTRTHAHTRTRTYTHTYTDYTRAPTSCSCLWSSPSAAAAASKARSNTLDSTPASDVGSTNLQQRRMDRASRVSREAMGAGHVAVRASRGWSKAVRHHTGRCVPAKGLGDTRRQRQEPTLERAQHLV